MKIIPILTEKSLNEAKRGKFTFWVPVMLRKNQISTLINKIYTVNTTSVKVMNYKPEKGRNQKGYPTVTKRRKKAVVSLKKGEIIEAFGLKKKAKKSKKSKAKK